MRCTYAARLSACAAFALLACLPAAAEVIPEETIDSVLDEMIVTASRREAAVFDVPYSARVVDRQRMEERGTATIPDAFRDDPSIMVQKTGQGQGSPFIRGFTGFRTLFMIDGIRLNNSTFRDGPNQYWNTVDPLTISRLEIVKGPSSVLYGSDAIGGTVNAITSDPRFRGEGLNVGGRAYYRFGSADTSHVGRLELDVSAGDRLAALAGVSLKHFNDVQAGAGTGNQPKTGYHEADGDIKLEYILDPDSRIIFYHQHVGQDDVWRSHRTIHAKSWHGTAVGKEKEWIYDQWRDLTYLKYKATQLGPLPGNATLSLSYQMQGEEQYRLRSNSKSDVQRVTVGTLGLGASFENVESPAGRISYGVEFYRDNVNSSTKKYKADGSLESIDIQGPVADDATYDLMGAFLQDEFPLAETLTAIAGVRYTHAEADANTVKDPVTGARTSLSDSWDNISASLRLLYYLTNVWNVYGGVSQGFRAPNLSDLSRLDTARSNEIETPSPGLDPERYLAYEIGTKIDEERWSGSVSYFYTVIRDMITRYPTGRVVDGLNEVQKANSGNGFMHGIELQADCKLTPQWKPFAGVAWQEGEVDTYGTSATTKSREPISRVPPLTGIVGLRFEPRPNRSWIEFECRMAAKQDRLSPDDKTDTQRIPPGGTPGYAVFNLRGGIRPVDDVTITAAVENIANTDYRIHGSGQNEPGTNVILALDYKF